MPPDTKTTRRVNHTAIYCTRALFAQWPRIARRWFKTYPRLFDSDDLRLTVTQPRNHFREWFAAIHLFHRSGARSLVEKYGASTHPRKRPILDSLLSDSEQDILWSICRHVQPPDLLVYDPQALTYSFVEVKGEFELIPQKQLRSHALIRVRLGVPVELIEVRIRS